MPISLEELAELEEKWEKDENRRKKEEQKLIKDIKRYLKNNIMPNMAYEKEEIDDVIKEFLLQRFKDTKPDIIHDFLFEKHKDLKKPEDWDFNTTFAWLTTPYNRTEDIDYPWYSIKEIFDMKLLHVGVYYVLKKPEEENERR